jgi:CHAT domain-containing protein
MKKAEVAWRFILATLLFTSCAAQEPFELNTYGTQRALRDGQISEALAYHEQKGREAEQAALAGSSAASNWELAHWHYREASRAARMSGQVQKMLAYAKKTLETARKTGSPFLEIDAIDTLVFTYRYVRDFPKVGELIEQGFALLPKLSDNLRLNKEGRLFQYLGHERIRLRQYEAAVDAFSRALNLRETYLGLFRRLSTGREFAQGKVISVVNQLGDAYRLANKLDEARAQYERAFNLVQVFGIKYLFEGRIHASVGETYLQQKRFTEALASFSRAMSFGESRQEPSFLIRVNQGIGDSLREMGRPADAVPYYQKAIQQIESTRSLLRAEENRQSYFEGELNPYIGMISSLSTLDRDAEAFEYSERARARTFLDVLGSRTPLARTGTMLEQERALQAKIASLRASIDEAEDSDRSPRASGKDLAEAQQAYNDLLAKVRKENQEQASLMNVEPLTVKQVQNLLDPAVTMLEYFVTQDGVLLWIVDKDGIKLVSRRITRKDLAATITKLRDSISQPANKEQSTAVSQDLYRVLIEPALPHIRGKELIIVPHDVLHYLPFQALQSSDGKYLIENYPISYLSSASLMQFTQEKRRAMGNNVLAFGNPDLGDRSRDLDYAEQEAQEVQSAYPGASVYVRREATEERAKAFSPQNDIIHFASHAELNENDPLSSAILLTKGGNEDGRLEVREIFGMNLKANLVVLSACDTGLGQLSNGDELVGLTRAFIYAGTPSVIASLWQVDDVATAQLMSKFYKNLKTMSKAEALRQAQLELIHGSASGALLANRGVGGVGKLEDTPKPQSTLTARPTAVSASHPYFWAPFILVGDGK